jgi:hypothetical protein
MSPQAREFNGYALFDDLEDKELQARNRAAVMRNISQDMGDEAVKDYCNLLPHPDQLYVVKALADIAGVK